MSTAMVSPFIDIDLYQQQNRRNHMVQRSLSFADRKTVGTPITGNSMTVNCQSQTHNMLNSSTSSSSAYRNRLSSIGSLSPLDSGRYSPESPTQFMPIPTTTTGSPILGNREQNSSSNNRKLDRSMSEPATDRNCNNTPHSPISQRGGQQSQNVNSSRYKTELCRPYEETRYCKYGDKCQFAHGQHELRSVARHPKYKTEPCRTFHTIGFCPYGPRCHFIHNEDERKMNQINHLRQQLPVSTSQPQQLTASPPSHNIQRPKALNFSLPLVRDSLGSNADSPPSSVSDGSSPTLSPTFLGEDYNLYSFGASPTSVPPPSAPPTVHHPGPAVSMPPNAFSFTPDLAAALSSMLSPLAVQTDQHTIASLAAGLNAISLNHRNNNDMRDLLHLHQQQQQQQPPSPPESLSGDSSASSSSTCGSPLDVSRGLRLPIFSRLSSD